MVQRGELQIEQLHIEVLRLREIVDIDHVMLQLGRGYLSGCDVRCHGGGSSLG
jgi:hypothetical protein